MKKLMVMILLLGVSLPAFADEQKIKCNYSRLDTGEKYSSLYLLDSTNNTLKILSDDTGEGFVYVRGGFVNESEFGSDHQALRSMHVRMRVDRSTGEFQKEFINDGASTRTYSGTCALFKQAF